MIIYFVERIDRCIYSAIMPSSTEHTETDKECNYLVYKQFDINLAWTAVKESTK